MTASVAETAGDVRFLASSRGPVPNAHSGGGRRLNPDRGSVSSAYPSIGPLRNAAEERGCPGRRAPARRRAEQTRRFVDSS